ncbi:MAG: sulfatase [Candidatus Hodarchaeota archaeon]
MPKPKGAMLLTLIIMLIVLSCSGPDSEQPLLTAEVPLHLEEHIDDAIMEGSEVPQDIPEAVEWHFDKPQPDWKPAIPLDPKWKPVRMEYTEDSLRLTLTKENLRPKTERLLGGIYVSVPDWERANWAYVLIRARTTAHVRSLGLGFNLRERPGPQGSIIPFLCWGDDVYVIKDGSVQTYMLKLDVYEEFEGPISELLIWCNADSREDSVSIDILSVSVIPREAIFATNSVGVQIECRGFVHRRSLYTHSPSRLKYRVSVPEKCRLDFGLGVVRKEPPVTFKVSIQKKGKEVATLFDKSYADNTQWSQHSIDLSEMAGETVTLYLENESEREGSVALWTAPTLSGKRSTAKPNVVFYVIDGGGADLMSVYGYNRRTTPNLERLAAEGAVFEHAYSNSSWTKISNPSFMTSLHNSVLGGFRSGSDALPENAVTMAQHLHRAGYQTALFTTNPYAGIVSSLDRGMDRVRDAVVENYSISSVALQNEFWRWRKAYPAEPFWVQFQTIDVHRPWNPKAPFAGLYISAERRRLFDEWERQLKRPTVMKAFLYEHKQHPDISLEEYLEASRDIYDESMAHQDYQIGQLVAQLKATGEWDHTLFIVAADHGQWATDLTDILSPTRGGEDPLFRPSMTHIPLIVVWPERITPGQRFSQPVSMIDIMPTILDLCGFPAPEMIQGQSLAPLLLGQKGWEPRPVILDEFYVDPKTYRLGGFLEVVDGRWGASMEIGEGRRLRHARFRRMTPPLSQRSVPLLLYDLWHDPHCMFSLHEERPDLVKKYTRFLQEKWKEHRELAKSFTRPQQTNVTAEQLRTLRALGYIE